MNLEHLYRDWFERLIQIWVTKDPQGILNICADKFRWYETPFDEPLTTKDELVKEWQNILHQEDIRVTYELLSTSMNTGIAHWHASYKQMYSKDTVELDGIFQVKLTDKGKCKEFRQWYNTKNVR